MARRGDLDTLLMPPPSERTGIGVINPGTRKAGIIAFRVFVGVSVALLVVYVQQFRALLQLGAAALHNWAGPYADRLAHTRHAGRPVRVGAFPWRAAPSNILITVAAAVVVAVAVWRLTKATRDDATETRAVRIVFITVAVAAGVVLAGGLLAQWEPARPVMALAVRALAQAAGSLAQFFARVGK